MLCRSQCASLPHSVVICQPDKLLETASWAGPQPVPNGVSMVICTFKGDL